MGHVWPIVASHEEQGKMSSVLCQKSPWDAGFVGTSLPSSKQAAGVQLGVTQLQAKPAQVSSKAEPKSKTKEDTAGKYKKQRRQEKRVPENTHC